MRSLRYLNTVLTVIAVLLTLNLWTLWTATPGGEILAPESQAHAQGAASAGEQRVAIVNELKSLNATVEGLKKTLTDGSIRATVTVPEQD